MFVPQAAQGHLSESGTKRCLLVYVSTLLGARPIRFYLTDSARAASGWAAALARSAPPPRRCTPHPSAGTSCGGLITTPNDFGTPATAGSRSAECFSRKTHVDISLHTNGQRGRQGFCSTDFTKLSLVLLGNLQNEPTHCSTFAGWEFAVVAGHALGTTCCGRAAGRRVGGSARAAAAAFHA